jgi:ATP-dependent Clp protease adaptor protein ClpS
MMAKPSVTPEIESTEQERQTPQYRVVLLDDNDHTYDYVIEMLQRIFVFSLEEAYRGSRPLRADGSDHL